MISILLQLVTIQENRSSSPATHLSYENVSLAEIKSFPWGKVNPRKVADQVASIRRFTTGNSDSDSVISEKLRKISTTFAEDQVSIAFKDSGYFIYSKLTGELRSFSYEKWDSEKPLDTSRPALIERFLGVCRAAGAPASIEFVEGMEFGGELYHVVASCRPKGQPYSYMNGIEGDMDVRTGGVSFVYWTEFPKSVVPPTKEPMAIIDIRGRAAGAAMIMLGWNEAETGVSKPMFGIPPLSKDSPLADRERAKKGEAILLYSAIVSEANSWSPKKGDFMRNAWVILDAQTGRVLSTQNMGGSFGGSSGAGEDALRRKVELIPENMRWRLHRTKAEGRLVAAKLPPSLSPGVPIILTSDS